MSVLGAGGEQLIRVGHEIVVFIRDIFFPLLKDRPQIVELRYNAGKSPTTRKEGVNEINKQILTYLT